MRITHLHRLELSLFPIMSVLFVVWTVLVITDGARTLDTHLRPPLLDPRSAPGQISEAFSLLTHPFVIFPAIGVAAYLSFQRRMRRLAVALGVAALAIPLQGLLAFWIDRPRPPTAFADSISHVGGAYPASHVTAVTVGAWVLMTLARAHRRPGSSMARSAILATTAVTLTAVCQWTMGLTYVSDVIGGLLLGAAVANLALLVGGVDTILSNWARLGLPEGDIDKRAAIVFNPTKFDDLSLLRRRVESEVLAAGWQPTVWLETTPDDPGHEAARRALDTGVDVVLVAGGDGTVRAVSAELSGTGTPMALLPSGTGNLLARNLGIPLDIDDALRLALTGAARSIDVVRARTDDADERFVVMAGLGLDAQIMDATNDGLKKVIRAGAYAVAAVQNAVPNPFPATVTLDDGEPTEQDVVMVLVGNVGTITAGMTLFPQASPSDGRIDLMLASPDKVIDWARLGAQILTGKDMEGFATFSAARLHIETDEPVPFELDGDTAGTTRSLTVEVEPGALRVIAPDA
ncbi:MAG: YegS/Rv2252/BmrU family lipid kinase [Actinomyces sp.]|uniref:YegS/Rv2252/BmrU family lipid kinase n=1 Tax=Actinomyces sp. TaxID=29317 RepID=UPI0026DD2179|nr:YegS/Rv2252/BmrU family lipid kinase [Actinomyces sp.]MDO4243844.1 YegS/Rv2252/BmrU family lipid kinase [Actinomyces sp.]